MSLRPRLAPIPAAMPVILPIVGADAEGLRDSRPEPRLTLRVEIPPTAEVLDLEMHWFPPMHAATLHARPGEWRVEGIGGWAALVTLRRRAAATSTSAAAASPRVHP